MLQSFITSFQLKNAYRVNSIIYSINQLPLIKRILPRKLYQSKGLKTLGNVISAFMEVIGTFLGKGLYVILGIFLMCKVYQTPTENTFTHIFLFLTFAGAVLNTYMFNPTKDKYYALIIMHMNAKEFTLSNYFYTMLKVFAGFMPFTIIFGVMAEVPLWICLVLPIFVVMVKMIFSTYLLCDFEKTKVARNENLPTKVLWGTVFILTAVSYGLPYLGIVVNQTIFIAVLVISVILGILSFYKIIHFTQYKEMYKQILTRDNVYAVKKQTSTKVIKENVSKKIAFDSSITSNKKGFAYFHDLFVKRHKKILTIAVKKQAAVISVILLGIIMAVRINNGFAVIVNGMLLTYLPYFVFIMYLLNRGTTMTQAMFMNCDYSMLTYRVYRTPKVILGLFKQRLKTLIKVNLLPALVIATGLPILLLITGGTDNYLNYAVLFISIIAMSIFFSVHYLVMYYVLQPYNVNTEMKSSTYKVVQTITYFVCYYIIQIKLPTWSFGIAVSVFCIFYSIISLFIAYRYAPKTFKLRV